MSQNDSRASVDASTKDEYAILEVSKLIDLKQLLVDDYLDIPMEVIPGYLTVTYRTEFGGEAMDTEAELSGMEFKSQIEQSHYSILRTLASSVKSINDDKLQGDIEDRVNKLKSKPLQLIDKLMWGHIVVREALRRWMNDPQKMEEEIKKSSGTP